MAKKIKPVSEECAPDEFVSSEQIDNVKTSLNAINSSINAEQKEKLENYNLLEEANKQLLKEKSELQDKIAEYLEELDKLRSNTCNDSLSSNIELALLKIEYKTLLDASDGYLMKISELTFENAKLNALLRELSNKQSSTHYIEPLATKKPETVIECPVYNPYKQNGYDSWN